MTRTECEQQLMNKMVEIRKILAEYSHNNDGVIMSVGQRGAWAFRIVGELDNHNVKDIDVFKYFEGANA